MPSAGGGAAAAASAGSTAAGSTGAAAANGGAGGAQRPRIAPTVCVMAMEAAEGGSELCSIEVASTADFAVCGRANGSLLMMRFSRDAMLRSRFEPDSRSPRPRSCIVAGHAGPVYAATASRCGQFVLSGSQDGGARLWGVRRGECLVAYANHGFPVWDVAFSPFNSQFATACYDGALRLFSTERRAPLRLLVGHHADVNAARFHPNGAYVLSASHDQTVRLWDVASGRSVRLLSGHTAPVQAVACSADGNLAASTGEDGSVLLWHLASGRVLHRLSAPRAAPLTQIAFHGSRVLLASGGTQLCLWDLKSSIATPAPSFAYESPVTLLSSTFMLSQQGLLLAAGQQERG